MPLPRGTRYRVKTMPSGKRYRVAIDSEGRVIETTKLKDRSRQTKTGKRLEKRRRRIW